MRTQSDQSWLVSLLLQIALLVAIALPAGALAATALEEIEQGLKAQSNIEQISNEVVLQDLIAENSLLVLFDVRTADEFAISHLPGAIRLDPGSSADDFFRNYGALLAGKQPVFYCSVGRRSTDLASTVASQIRALDQIRPPANMIGGIFRWHNESKPLVNAEGSTDKVHPYSWYWKRLLEHPEKAIYKLPTH